jgi:hypothetical protein
VRSAPCCRSHSAVSALPARQAKCRGVQSFTKLRQLTFAPAPTSLASWGAVPSAAADNRMSLLIP